MDEELEATEDRLEEERRRMEEERQRLEDNIAKEREEAGEAVDDVKGLFYTKI